MQHNQTYFEIANFSLNIKDWAWIFSKYFENSKLKTPFNFQRTKQFYFLFPLTALQQGSQCFALLYWSKLVYNPVFAATDFVALHLLWHFAKSNSTSRPYTTVYKALEEYKTRPNLTSFRLLTIKNRHFFPSQTISVCVFDIILFSRREYQRSDGE